MWGKIGYSIYIICIHIYILWKLHRTSVLIKQIQFQCYVMLSVSILSIFTLEYLPFDYMQTLEEKKKKKGFPEPDAGWIFSGVGRGNSWLERDQLQRRGAIITPEICMRPWEMIRWNWYVATFLPFPQWIYFFW